MKRILLLIVLTGAAYTSTAMIENIRPGLEDAATAQAPTPQPMTEARVKQGKVKGLLENGLGALGFLALPDLSAENCACCFSSYLRSRMIWL